MSAPVSSGEVDAKAANLGRQQKHKDTVIVVEVVDQACAHCNICGAIHSIIPGKPKLLGTGKSHRSFSTNPKHCKSFQPQSGKSILSSRLLARGDVQEGG